MANVLVDQWQLYFPADLADIQNQNSSSTSDLPVIARAAECQPAIILPSACTIHLASVNLMDRDQITDTVRGGGVYGWMALMSSVERIRNVNVKKDGFWKGEMYRIERKLTDNIT